MPRRSNPEKIKQWTRRLKRFEASKRTSAAFCRGEGISVASLYQWRRRLRENRDAVPASSQFQAVRVASPTVQAIQEPTVIQLVDGIHIQLGTDLAIVELVVERVLAATIEGRAGVKSC
jgi:transposase-like protein